MTSSEATGSGFVLWLTGAPGSGKTTIAKALRDHLRSRGVERVEILDGDELRASLNRDLGFSREDRDENVRRVGAVAEILARNGIAVIVSLVSPYEDAREEVRARIPRFVLAHVDCALETRMQRDPKGHYKRAASGDLARFTGVSDPYETPRAPDVTVRTDVLDLGASVDALREALAERGYLPTVRTA